MHKLKLIYGAISGLALITMGTLALCARLYFRVKIDGHREIDFLSDVGYFSIAVAIIAGLFLLRIAATALLKQNSHRKSATLWAEYQERRAELSLEKRIEALNAVIIRDHSHFPFAACLVNLDVLEECRNLAPHLEELIVTLEDDYERLLMERVRLYPAIVLRPELDDIAVDMFTSRQLRAKFKELMDAI